MPIDLRDWHAYTVGMTKEQAIAHYGTQQKLAEALGLTQGTISGWPSVPEIHQIRLERITDGALKADPECWTPKPKTAA